MAAAVAMAADSGVVEAAAAAVEEEEEVVVLVEAVAAQIATLNLMMPPCYSTMVAPRLMWLFALLLLLWLFVEG